MDKEIIYEDESGIRVVKVNIDGKVEKELIINGIFIMASYNAPSSISLIKDGISQISKKENIKILIGGLGMGYSLCEAIKYISEVKVIEIDEKIISINRTIFNNSKCMDLSNVEIINEDFFKFVNRDDNLYDLIVMDIDNGPMQLLYEENNRVYEKEFFNIIRRRLYKNGVFGVWSCNYDEKLFKELKEIFGNCEVKIINEKVYNKKLDFYLFFAK